MVEAADESSVHKEQLSARFQELIDLIAMKKQLVGTDAYLVHWQKRPAESRDGSSKEAAQAVAREIEDRYDEICATALANAT